MLDELNKEEVEAAQAGVVFAQKSQKTKSKNLKESSTALDAHLDGTISREEYTAKKENLITEKAELSEKLKDFERKRAIIGSNRPGNLFWLLNKPKLSKL